MANQTNAIAAELRQSIADTITDFRKALHQFDVKMEYGFRKLKEQSDRLKARQLAMYDHP